MTDWTPAEMPDLEGKTVVVTGANSGLGLEGTRAFARKGATVVMACRSVDRGERAAGEIRESAASGPGSGPDPDLDVRECDLASLDSIRSFAEGLAADYDAVDVLCNNAGVMAIPRRETADGFETQFGVNHLGHFALTGRLFDLLTAADGVGVESAARSADSSRTESGAARVVTQSSGAHEQGEMDFTDLNWEESYGKWKAYGRSKLANLLFAYELQRRIDAAGDLGVRSVACHPGYADTDLQMRTARESGNPLVKVGMRLANAVFGQDAEVGVEPMLYAATADVDGGAYVEPGGFMNMRGHPTIGRSNDASYDRADARRLWEYSAEATGVAFPFRPEEPLDP
ncbi:NAD(P)-dependent dehydrogenase, short-chain alcohol dehydrogenase family [Halorubrum aquaticum]|uniref:NAD(P)-dependent dehydrogenase, short-chain alcohol dehydrogenase family n=1 Tax=Halorubrum aquaticum TaxID=387340 RepID=A0A1I3BDA8_9EURY|nr:SDR family NAD(P)-dependent oxidoreductase [Halorubrum aquaticum]SFH60130.1 NAD(P)-dependent dehydrogenase, short-chain alcohol dehydrogenase family [Halorubrum aquaticum]